MVSDSSNVNKKNYLRLMEAIGSNVDDNDSTLVCISVYNKFSKVPDFFTD